MPRGLSLALNVRYGLGYVRDCGPKKRLIADLSQQCPSPAEGLAGETRTGGNGNIVDKTSGAESGRGQNTGWRFDERDRP